MARFGMSVDATRTLIAFIVIALGIVGISAVSAVAIGFASADQRPEMARLAFASILPLLGTWVGTVLAFYFVRDNLQAANETTLKTLRLAGGLGEETLVSTIMIRVDRIRPRRDVENRAAADAIRLSDLYADMMSHKQSRVPFLTSAGVALYVVHEPDIDKYAQDKGVQSAALEADDTVARLLSTPAIKAAVETFVAVTPATTLAEARSALSKSPECKDVFVTEGGKITDKALGWLTNSELARSD